MPSVLQDAAFAVRSLRRRPAFTAGAVLTLALGIGATSAIYSVVKAVLLSGLPYPQAERLVYLAAEKPAESIFDRTFRVVELQEIESRTASFEAVGGYFAAGFVYQQGEDQAVRLEGAMVSPGYFDVLGAAPIIGSGISEAATAARERVVVLSETFWRRNLSADPEVVGKAINLNQNDYLVIGVLPASFDPPAGDPMVFIPYSVGTAKWIGRWLALYGRLAPGATQEVAASEVNALLLGLGATESRTAGYTAGVTSLTDRLLGDVRPQLVALSIAVALVLLISSGNVANLVLTRSLGRRQELDIRRALGAGTLSLARLTMAENLLLGLAGAGLGLLLAGLLLPTLLAMAPAGIPLIESASLDGGVVLFTVAAGLFTGLALGVAPLVSNLRRTPADLSLKSRDGSRSWRWLGVIVSAEVALAFLVLGGAGLLVRSYRALSETDLGVRTDGVVAMLVDLPGARYAEHSQVMAYYDDLTARLEALPEVRSAAVGGHLPLGGRGSWLRVQSEEGWRSGSTDYPAGLQRVAGNGFFRTLGIPLLEGRVFGPGDLGDGTPVVIVNQSLAQRFWPDRSAVGERVTFSREPTDDDWRVVVGVVGDVRYQGVGVEPEPQVYSPHSQSSWKDMYLLVSHDGDDLAMLSSVRELLSRIDPAVAVDELTTIRTMRATALSGPRFALALFGGFALTALLLAVAGTFAVLNYAVSQQRRSLGIRLALGAQGARVTRMMLSQGLRYLVAGSIIGMSLALVAGRFLESLLYQTVPLDGATWLAVLLVMGTAVLVAALGPAMSAARVDPIVVLREE